MKIFATSDIHGNKGLVYAILSIIEQNNIDALVLAGDITAKGLYQFFKVGEKCEIHTDFYLKHRKEILATDEQQVKTTLDFIGFMEVFKRNHKLTSTIVRQQNKLHRICRLLSTINKPIYMLSGNDDYASEVRWDEILKLYEINNLNLNTYKLNDFTITGVQYVLPSTRRTHNELAESDVAHRLKKIESHLSHNSFFVTHCPPKGVFDLRANGIADGSSSILDLIKNRQPAFHVFGHVHDEFGEKQVGNTRCCNVSSLWTEWILRGYIIDTDKKTVKRVEHRISFEELNLMLEKNKVMNY